MFGLGLGLGLAGQEERVSAEFKQFASENGMPLLNFDDFEIIEFLCSGSYGACYKAKRRSNGEVVALKFFGYASRNPVSSTEVQRGIEKEIEVDWTFNDFPSTAKCFGYMIDTYEGYVKDVQRVPAEKDTAFRTGHCRYHTGKIYKCRTVVKVSECLRAEVLDYLLTISNINEKEVSRIFKNFVEGLAFIHNANYIHRDLKPENIMFNENGELRLIDFGSAIAIPNGATQVRDNLIGTPSYFAPESILNGVYSKATDMWQVGVILYILLFSLPAFTTNQSITIGKYDIPRGTSRSEGALDLLSKILHVNPSKRLTCEQILRHPWITREGELEASTHEVQQFGAEYINNIKEWSYKSKLKYIFSTKIAESIKRKRILTYAFKEKTNGQDINLTVDQFNTLRDDFFRVNIELCRQAEEESPDDSPVQEVTSVLGFIGYAPSFVSSFFGGSPTTRSSPKSPSIRVVAGGKSSALSYAIFSEIMIRNQLQPFATRDIFHVFDIDSNDKIDYFEFMLNLASLRVDNKSEHLEEEANMYFDIFDMNKDGTIQREEFASVIHHLLGNSIRRNYPFHSLTHAYCLPLTQVVQRMRIALTSINYSQPSIRPTRALAWIAKSSSSSTRR